LKVKERLLPTTEEVAEARRRLDAVKVEPRHVWASDAGTEFLDYCAELYARGVALTWLADRLGIPPGNLSAQLRRRGMEA
jgi:hypothetical protein